jgi:hypothetical protein
MNSSWPNTALGPGRLGTSVNFGGRVMTGCYDLCSFKGVFIPVFIGKTANKGNQTQIITVTTDEEL